MTRTIARKDPRARRQAGVGDAMMVPDAAGKCTLFIRDSVTRVNWRTGPQYLHMLNDLLVDSGGRAIECRDEQGDDFQLTAPPLDRYSPVALR